MCATPGVVAHTCLAPGAYRKIPGDAKRKRYNKYIQADAYYHAILSALPVPVFVVDADVRIKWLNRAAADTFQLDMAAVVELPGGEALNCVNAGKGCGKAPSCVNCAIRRSVAESLSGCAVSRRRIQATLLANGIPKHAELLLTTTALPGGEGVSLLILEDITELSALRELIPICAKCKRVRNDRQYWESVEAYFHQRIGAEFTHGLCGHCIKDLYPDLLRES